MLKTGMLKHVRLVKRVQDTDDSRYTKVRYLQLTRSSWMPRICNHAHTIVTHTIVTDISRDRKREEDL
jgi:hypothetical protein